MNEVQPFSFGEWNVWPRLNRLAGPSGVQVLEPRLMRVLTYLAKLRGQAVSKEELLEEVWAGATVTEDSVTVSISELRRLLADSPQKPRYIETVRKVGYRFLQPVQPLNGDPPDLPTTPGALLWPRPSLQRWRLGLALLLLAALVFSVIPAIVATLRGEGRPSEGEPPSPLSAATVTVPITSHPALDLDPSPSPDGEWLAFVRHSGKWPTARYRIYLQAAHGNEARPLFEEDEAAYEGSPAWSPEGHRLAYLRCVETPQCEVYLWDLRGGARIPLVESKVVTPASIAWAADGKSLFYTDSQDPAAGSQILQIRLAEGVPQPRTRPPSPALPARYPILSPDGRYLAFVRGDERFKPDLSLMSLFGEILLLDLETDELQTLSTDPQEIFGITWTELAGGPAVVYATHRNHRDGLLLALPLAGGGERVLLSARQLVRHPTYDPHRRRLLMEFWQGNRDLFRQPLGTSAGEDREPLVPSTLYEGTPQLSPEGGRLVFSSHRGGSGEFWLLDLQGRGEPRRLTHLGGGVPRSPRWSPDGHRIALVALRPEGSELLLLDPAEPSALRKLTIWRGEANLSGWSSDGRYLYVGSTRHGEWRLERVDVEGGGVEVLEAGARGGGWWQDGEGKLLLFTRPDRAGLWARSPDSATAELLFPELSREDYDNWQFTRRGIVFPRRNGDGITLLLGNPRTGETEAIGHLPSLTFNSLALSVDLEGGQVIHEALMGISADIAALPLPVPP